MSISVASMVERSGNGPYAEMTNVLAAWSKFRDNNPKRKCLLTALHFL
jgi:hypothetical protein